MAGRAWRSMSMASLQEIFKWCIKKAITIVALREMPATLHARKRGMRGELQARQQLSRVCQGTRGSCAYA
jgi:hypothetical protein